MKRRLQRAGLALISGVLLMPALAEEPRADPMGGRSGPFAPAGDSNTAQQNEASHIDRDNWREEFDRICIQTNTATTLSADQLSRLIADSNRLLEVMETLDHPHKKVFVLRLKNCREFFKFALEVRNTDPG